MNTLPIEISAIISGGQTGVDRGALDAALDMGIPHGGWCPLGRRAEDGVIPDQYHLQPTTSPHYRVRTEKNVLDTDGTLVLARGPLGGGTALTCALARSHRRPCHVVDLRRPAMEDARQWLAANDIHRLNVAGPRESQNRGIEDQAKKFLIALLGVHGREQASLA